MKKIHYIILFILGAVVASCSPQQDNFFEESASQRVNKSMVEVQNVLSSAKNGWLFQYFPGTKKEYGGFNMVVSFTADGKTTVYNNLVNKGAASNSSYTIKQFGGVMLSFDTHNAALHYFSDPVNPDNLGAGRGKGLEGDFEFVVVNHSIDMVTLRGVKTGNICTLTPLKEGITPKSCLDELTVASKNINAPLYEMYVNAKKVTVFSGKNNYFRGVFNVNGEPTTLALSCITTLEGIKLYQPVTFDDLGKDVYLTNFKFDAKLDRFISTDSGVDVYIQKVYPPINETVSLSVSPLLFSPNNMSDDVKLAYQKAVDGSKAEGEDLKYMYLAYSSKLKTMQLIFQSGGYKGIFTMPITLVSGSKDQLTIKKTGADDNAAYYYAKANYSPFISLLDGITYIVSSDNDKEPTNIKFVNANNPNSWFILQVVK